MSRQKKIMVLGASRCQIPIMREAQAMGYFVIAVSIAGDYPGFEVADKYYQIDVRDKETILKTAERENIVAVLTDQTDIPVQTAAYVAESLGLPGIGTKCALFFTNKFEMRNKCLEIGIPVPRHAHAISWEDAANAASRIGYPLILKPVDSQGSRGVSKVVSRKQLPSAFKAAIAASACGSVICEEYFEGDEIVIQGFAADGNFHNLIMGDRQYFEHPNLFIPSRTLFPTRLESALVQRLNDFNKALVKTLNPAFGITHSEYLVNRNTGELKLVEIAIRGGGVYISSDLVPLACGININRLLLENALGLSNPGVDISAMIHRASAYICFYLPQGVIKCIQGRGKLCKIPGVHKVFLDDLKVGKTIEPLRDKTMRLGPILIHGTDRDHLYEIIQKVKQTLKIDVKTTSGNIGGIIW